MFGRSEEEKRLLEQKRLEEEKRRQEAEADRKRIEAEKGEYKGRGTARGTTVIDYGLKSGIATFVHGKCCKGT